MRRKGAFTRLEPPEAAVTRVTQKAARRIRLEVEAEPATSFVQRWFWWVLPVPALALVLMMAVLFRPAAAPSLYQGRLVQGEIRLAHGGAGGSFNTPGDDFPVETGTLLELRRAGTIVQLHDQDDAVVDLAGKGTFEFRPGLMKIINGQGRAAFRLAGKRLEFASPHVVMGILGTAIDFVDEGDREELTLVEGSATYRVPSSGRSGTLHPGETLAVIDQQVFIRTASASVDHDGSPAVVTPPPGEGAATSTSGTASFQHASAAGELPAATASTPVDSPAAVATAPEIDVEPATEAIPSSTTTIRRIDDAF